MLVQVGIGWNTGIRAAGTMVRTSYSGKILSLEAQRKTKRRMCTVSALEPQSCFVTSRFALSLPSLGCCCSH